MNKFVTFTLILVFSSCVGSNSSDRNSKSTSNTDVKEVAKSEDMKSDESQMTTEQLAKANKIILDHSSSAKDIDGLKIYKTYCAICHGRGGDLKVNDAKDLTVSNVSLENAVAQVYFGKGLMTPFNSILEEEEIVAVSKYVETLRK